MVLLRDETGIARAFTADDICTESEADWCRRIARASTVPGGGYERGKAPPAFRGVTVSGFPAYVDGRLKGHERAFLVEMLERMKYRIQTVYEVRVCCGHAALTLHEAVEGVEQNTLLHPWHADHDTRDSDSWRAYAAVLYLNDPAEFGGGEFVLRDKGDTGTAVRPAVGRMVGFDATQVHGSTAVSRGERIALVGWYGLLGTTPLERQERA